MTFPKTRLELRKNFVFVQEIQDLFIHQFFLDDNFFFISRFEYRRNSSDLPIVWKDAFT